MWDGSYNYEKYSRQTDETGSRLYQVGEYNVPSVTTILSKTQSEDKRKKLDEWRERVGYTEAARITQKAATRGTEMHYVLENYINGIGYLNLSEKGAEARLMAHEVVKGLPELTKVYGSEVSLAYEDRWAGSTDLVCEFKGKPTILDFKQSNKPKKTEWISDYFLQLTAYAEAHNEVYGTDINKGVILMCVKPTEIEPGKYSKAPEYMEWIIEGDEFNKWKSEWWKRVEQYYEMELA